ncbi:MAG: MlaD family protein [Planctomycetota bacterium]
MDERRRNAWVVSLVLLLGGALTLYFTAYLKRDELRPWRRIQADFVDVGGLKVKDAVMLNGARVGRVADIHLYKDRQRALLEVEPGLPLYSKGIRIEIVPTNALGGVAIDLDPGEASSPPLAPDAVLEGRIRPALGAGGGTPTPGRRKELAQQFRDFANETDRMLLPDSGATGSLLFDPERARDTRAGLHDLAKLWAGIDQALAGTEARATQDGILSRESLLLALETSGAFASTTRALEDAVKGLLRREGTAGRLVADPQTGRDLREALGWQHEFWSQTTAGEGTLGRALQRRADMAEALQANIADWEEVTARGDRGEGLLGILSSPEAGKGIRETLTGVKASLQRADQSELVRNPKAVKSVDDTFGDVDDFLLNLRRGLRGLRSTLPDKTFQGVVFAVF